MSAAHTETDNLFHVVGAAIAAAQIFETVFVLGAGLALTQSHVDVLEDIEPVSEAKSFKKPLRNILKELNKAQSIDSALEARVSTLIDDRHRVVHRLFREFGWPASVSPNRELEIRSLCKRVTSESFAMSIVFLDLVLTWMQRFPATLPVAIEHEGEFRELADRIRGQL